MVKVHFCKNCGGMLDENWLYCPLCGKQIRRSSYNWEDVVDNSLNKVDIKLDSSRLGRLESLSDRLELMETELNMFIKKTSE